MNEIVEALKECEYAIQKVIETGTVGWVQESAHKSACAALENAKSNEKDQRQEGASYGKTD